MLALPLVVAAFPGAAADKMENDVPKVDIKPDPDAPMEARDLPEPDVAATGTCPDSATPDVLSSGTAVIGTDTTGSYGAPDCHYKITVASPSGMRLRVVLATTEDHDVFVKLGTPATASPYACSGTGTATTSETCTVDPISAGDYYIRVSRWTSGSGDFTLTAFVEPQPVTCGLGAGTTPLSDATPVTTTVTLDLGARCQFSYTFPAGNNLARVNLTPSNSSNNVNLYAKYNVVAAGSPPSGADCSSTLTGASVDTCSVTKNGQTVFITVYRPAAGTFDATFTIRVDSFSTCGLGSGVTALSSGVNVTSSLTWDLRANCAFSFAPGGADLGRFNQTPATDNFDLRVKLNELPTFATATVAGVSCASSLSALSTDSCSLAAGPADTLYALVFRTVAGTATRNFNVRADGLNTCSLGSGVTALADGIPQLATLTADSGSTCSFSATFPLSRDFIKFNMTPPASGFDPDLYVKKGSMPTTSVYDCRPFLSGNASEVCQFANDGSTFYAKTIRFSGSGTLSMLATGISTCSLGTGIVTSLADSVPLSASLTNDTGANCLFSFVPSPSGDVVTFDMSPPALADFDLYVKKGATPTTSSYDCYQPAGNGTAERCQFANDGSTLYAMVRRVGGSGSFSITAASVATCSLGLGTTSLTDSVAQSASLANLANAQCRFSFAPAPSGDVVTVDLSPPALADFDLYVKKGAAPTTSDFDCYAPAGVGLAEACSLPNDGSTVFALVLRVSGGGSFTISAASVATCSLGIGATSLSNGIAQLASLSNLNGSTCRFVFTPPLTEDTVSVSMTPPVGSDFDTYVRKGAAPTTSTYDCWQSGGVDESETCTLSNDGGDVYAMIRRVSGSGEFSVTARAFSPCSFGNGDQTLLDGIAATASLSADVGAVCFFKFAPGAVDLAKVVMTPSAAADFDVYLNSGSRPSTTANGCASETVGDGASELCTVAADGNDVFAMVRRVSGEGDFTITMSGINTCSLGLGDHALTAGVGLDASLTSDLGAVCYFKFTPAGAVDLSRVILAPSTGDFDLYTKIGSRPTTESFDCASLAVGTAVEERCTHAASLGDVYAMVRRSSGEGAFSVTGLNINTCSLGQGDHVLTDGVGLDASLTDDPGAACFFKFTPGTGVDLARVLLAPATGDFDLYTKIGSRPTTASFGCASATAGAAASERCTLSADLGDVYVMVRRSTGSGAFSVTGLNVNVCSLGQGDTVLSSGVALSASLTDDAGAVCYFKFTPGTGIDLTRVLMTPGSGNFDLYTKIGSRPTTTSFTCSSLNATAGATEKCSHAPSGSDVYAMVRRVSGSGAFSVTALNVNFCSLGQGDSLVADGVDATASLTDDAGAACYFKLTPGAGYDGAKATLTTSAGSNFDLYVKIGSRPTTTSYGCLATTTGVDTCQVVWTSGDVYVMVRRTTGSGSFTLRAESVSSCSLGPGVHPILDGVNISASLSTLTGAKCYFEFAPGPAADFAHIVLPATTPADFDLYVKKGAVPTASSYDCRPYLGGSSVETCDSLITDSQHYFIMVLRYSGSGAFTVAASAVVVPTLENGAPALSNVAQGAMGFWKVVVPANATTLALAIAGDVSQVPCAALDANGGPGTCATAYGPTSTACAAAETANPGTCAGARAQASAACTALQTTCPDTNVRVVPTNADLYVRFAAGLPTTSLYDCRGANAGSVESCVFDTGAAGGVAQAKANYTQARSDVWANCPPEQSACASNAIPAWPGLPGQVNLLPFKGAGRYYVGVRGTTGPADYAIVALWN